MIIIIILALPSSAQWDVMDGSKAAAADDNDGVGIISNADSAFADEPMRKSGQAESLSLPLDQMQQSSRLLLLVAERGFQLESNADSQRRPVAVAEELMLDRLCRGADLVGMPCVE